MVGPDAYGEAVPVGEPEYRPLLAVLFSSGDAAVDGYRVPGFRPGGQTRVQAGMVAGGGAVAELAPVHRLGLTGAAYFELGGHVGVVVVFLEEPGD